ncbi:MAG: dihydrodipicolinate synthase family protein [Pirellulaceae bacterium]|nr:dihydrodipicolinate synthase family protein [Pirellulaceae bacterium]MDP7015320.1 dihydrodipicolinate synthase family protein [Pirellulaceae bacterium]
MSDAIRARMRTVQLVPITAFDESGALNLEPMRELMRRSYAAGIRVVIPCAGSAEFHALSADEIIRVIQMTRETVGSDMVIVAPVGQRLDWALELGRRAMDAGADALLIMPLNFPYLSNEGSADYYRAVLDRVDAPTQIYKKAAIPADSLLLELADHPNLVGVKYAVNDMDAFQTTIRADGGRIDWYCGSAERYSPYYALAGAPGYTSGAGNVCPHVTLAMHAAMKAGEWKKALRLQQVLLPIEHGRGRDDNSYNVSFLKHAIRHVGLDFGEPRTPQRRLSEAERREIDEIMPPILEEERRLAEIVVF